MSRLSQPAPRVVPFGSYLLDEEIARGGMARVFRARLRGVGGFEKVLVVKQILPELSRDPRFVSMFVREAKTLVQMSHPHVVPVYELGVLDGVYFLAMEHVDGASLTELLADGPLPPDLVAHVGVHVAEALAYAHDKLALVHRDVTPNNVLVDGLGHARLLDFGIAAPVGDEGEVFGSPGYMSPEQVRGEPVGTASDLFSLGAVLYRALTGAHAFLRDAPEQTRAAVLEAAPPRFDDAPAVPPELAALLDPCFAKEAGARPSAAGLARGLRGFLAAQKPEGVAHELGHRVEGARTRTSTERPRAAPTPAEGRDPSHVVQTLATSKLLEAILEGSAELDFSAAAAVAADRAGADPEVGTAPITERIVERRRAPEPTTPPVVAGLADAEPDVATEALAHRRGAAKDAPSSDAADAADAADAQTDIAPDADVSVPAPAPVAAPPGGGKSRLLFALVGAGLLLLGGAAWLGSARTGRAGETPDAPATTGEAARPPEEAVPAPPPEPPATPVPPAPEALPQGPVVPEAGDPTTPVEAGLSRAPGSLTVSAQPWATVRLGSRTLGDTPLRDVRVPAGSHTLELENPALGVTARRRVEVPPGGRVRVAADLTADPPRVQLR